jgi:dihydrodipicolinate synthetase family protein
MSKRISREALSGVWSATPTPFTDDMVVDNQSVNRMVAHHCRLGVKDLFLAGTCGEGAWLPEREKRRLVAPSGAPPIPFTARALALPGNDSELQAVSIHLQPSQWISFVPESASNFLIQAICVVRLLFSRFAGIGRAACSKLFCFRRNRCPEFVRSARNP